MKRFTLAAICLVVIACFTSTTAFAGSPHFVQTCTATLNPDNTVTFSGKEAGLGDEAQISAQFTIVAECINPGSNHPKASNKTANTFTQNFPVQNGKAEESATVGPVVTSPSCTPPMTLAIATAAINDLTNGISQNCTVQ
jgi:hypothetical protein